MKVRDELFLDDFIICQRVLFQKQVIETSIDDDEGGVGKVVGGKVDHTAKVGKVTDAHKIADKGEETWWRCWIGVSAEGIMLGEVGGSTSDAFEKRDYNVHRWHPKLDKATLWNRLLERETRTMADGLAVLKLC
jgi:hypothetical protein